MAMNTSVRKTARAIAERANVLGAFADSCCICGESDSADICIRVPAATYHLSCRSTVNESLYRALKQLFGIDLDDDTLLTPAGHFSQAE
jgi:hypothetical protein